MARGKVKGSGGPAIAADVPGPLEPGIRVSLELPHAGTCVAVVGSQDGATVLLELLDDVREGELEAGATVDLFMPRPQGMYHWLCRLRSRPSEQRAEVELLGAPVFVQRRLVQRVEAGLQAQVRRIRSSRRGTAHEARVADLSRGGMKLEGPFQLSTGDTLEVTVDLGAKVQLVGRTVMAYPLSKGEWVAHVSFSDGQSDAIDLVDDYIAQSYRH